MTVQRALFLLTVAAAALSIWLAPHPPMIDLPQHAGQLALLKQMLSGDTRWSGLFQINPFTPYLIGFALALPLTFVMSIAAALKLMLTLAFIAFVTMCVTLRKHFRADARLDWLFICPFFGFAYHWGFFTFLTAAPLGLLLIWLCDRYGQAPTRRRGIGLAATGLVLLVSHGLVFLFALGASACLLLARAGSFGKALRRAWPLYVMAAALVAYFVARGPAEQALAVPATVPSVMWQLGLRHEVLGWSLGLNWNPLYAVAAALMLLAPWLLGLRPGRAPRAAWIPFVLVALLLCFVPSFMFETSYVYQRFSLLLFPAYAWLFLAPNTASSVGTLARIGQLALVLAVWAVVGLNASRFWQFGRESTDFDRVEAMAQPGQRALALLYDRSSAAMHDIRTYVNHVAWYQTEYAGLVDFNFAWVQPQIVRYRLGARPPVGLGFAWRPQDFDWVQHRGDTYRYFFVRGVLPPDAFKGAACPPQLRSEHGLWQLYERAECVAAPAPAP